MFIKSRIFLLLILFLISETVVAERPPNKSWTFTFQFENDLFTDTDRFYTNGIKFSWISPEFEWFNNHPWLKDNPNFKRFTEMVGSRLPYHSRKNRQRHIALSFGQKMFTPEDITQRSLVIDDRPYAGWLYGSAAFHTKTSDQLDTFEIQAGFTGDFSLAEQAQDFVHEIRGIEKANGWDNQIDTELGIALIYDRKYRFLRKRNIRKRFAYDSIVHVGAALGTVFTHANAGIEVRFGWNLPSDFGTALIRPAGDTNAPADRTDPRYQSGLNGFSFHVFAASSGRFVLRDIFLDGNTFSDSHEIDKENLIGDFVLGASMTYNGIKLSYSQVWRSKEFKGQDHSQKFGSINLAYTY